MGDEFEANWRAAPPTPQYFDLGLDEDSDCSARDGSLETAAAGPYSNGAPSGVSVPNAFEGSGDVGVACLLNDLVDLLELAEAGEHVEWPAGWSEHSARAAIHARPVEAAPAKKPRIVLQPEAERNGGSTPFIPRPKAVPIVKAVRAKGNGVHSLPMFGSGHDLRLSGQVVWCRKCGRYGEERVRADGLGGPCKGPRSANPAHMKDLRRGIHPRTGLCLPLDVAYVR